jgi:DNA-binding IclR family transcriptional regulator
MEVPCALCPVHDSHQQVALVELPGSIQSIERAAAILRLLSEGVRPIGVVDLSAELDLPKGTVHGLLRTLMQVGFVEQNPDTSKYQLGAGLLHMGSRYLGGNELRARALLWSDSLAARTHEVVRIGVLHDSRVLIVHHVLQPERSFQTFEVGSLLPVHATALGKVLLAHDRLAMGQLAERSLMKFTDATLTNHHSLACALVQIRQQGWATESGELLPDKASIAAPIVGRHRMVVGAIGIFGTRDRLIEAGEPGADLLTCVCEAARAISRDLGANPW